MNSKKRVRAAIDLHVDMMRTPLWRVVVLAVVMATVPVRAHAGTRRPAVLFLSANARSPSGGPAGIRTWDDWLASGFEVHATGIQAIKALADLSKFNVVVVNFLPGVTTGGRIAPEQLVFEKVLDRYVREGGGCVVFCGGGAWHAMSPALRHLVEPYGASVPEEQIVDPDHVRHYVHSGKVRCNWTTQIAAASMTKGLSLIGYVGQASRADVIKLTMPVVIKDTAAWQVVVRAEKTAYSAVGVKPGTGAALKTTPATYSQSPVMAAWRTVGKGRLFLYPHNVAYTVTSPEVFDRYFWDTDDLKKQGVPQNRAFIMQSVRWAAEPSLASGRFGGFRTDRNLRRDAELILKANKPIDWAKAPTGDRLAPKMGMLRGVIGAQGVTGGASTVRSLCGAARRAGLDFLGFTEPLERLNETTWERLKAECDRCSDDKFLALPGMVALDKVGNTWFALGWATFPKPSAVTPDAKRLDNTYAFFFRVFNRRLVGFANVGRNPNPWYEMKQSSGFAVYSLEKGVLRDDSRKDYLGSCYDMENYVPVVYHRVTSPGEVATAARGMANVFTGRSVKGLKEYAQGVGRYRRDMFWEAPHHWYLTQGPKLEYNGGVRLHNFAIDQEVENLFRYGFKISGLKKGDEIRLMDGPAELRKWIASGPTFATEHTWPHEQVRAFVVAVVRNGRTVMLGSPVTLNYGRRFNQCGDRQNTLPFNYQPDDRGDWHVTDIPLGARYRGWTPSTLVYATSKNWQIGAIGIEMTPQRIMTWFTGPNIPFDSPRKEWRANLASHQRHRLSCPGVIIVDEVCKRVYPNGGRHTGDCTPPKRAEPLQQFHFLQRRYAIYGMVGQLNGQLVKSRIVGLQDAKLKGNASRVLVSASNYNVFPNTSPWVEKSVGVVFLPNWHTG